MSNIALNNLMKHIRDSVSEGGLPLGDLLALIETEMDIMREGIVVRAIAPQHPQDKLVVNRDKIHILFNGEWLLLTEKVEIFFKNLLRTKPSIGAVSFNPQLRFTLSDNDVISLEYSKLDGRWVSFKANLLEVLGAKCLLDARKPVETEGAEKPEEPVAEPTQPDQLDWYISHIRSLGPEGTITVPLRGEKINTVKNKLQQAAWQLRHGELLFRRSGDTLIVRYRTQAEHERIMRNTKKAVQTRLANSKA